MLLCRGGPHPFPFSRTLVLYKHMQPDDTMVSNRALLEEEERAVERETK